MAAIGSISTSHHLATEAGAKALRAGGNALDAALAAAATLCVVYPHNVALGGDLVALVRDPSGQVHFLNATGPAPAAVDAEALRRTHGEALPLRGIDTVTVPGGVRGWDALHRLGARLDWSAHFEFARDLAAHGTPVSRSLRAGLVAERADLLADPGSSQVFAPDGALLEEGDLLRQPALAETLRCLAAQGAREFYSGETARKWVSTLRKLGSRITLDDTSAFTPRFEPAIETRFRGHRVVTSPPNTSGFILSRVLDRIEGAPADPLGTGIAEMVEAIHVGNVIRSAFLADPEHGGMTADELVSLDYAGEAGGVFHPTGDTVGLSAVSSDGWAVSFINSLFYRFGSCILDPETGVLFQNRGTSFSLRRDSPNVISGGKRPSHTLMPVLVFREDQLVYVPSTMGGAGQPQIHAQLLLRLLSGESPEQAIDAPRFLVKEPDTDRIGVIVESDLDPLAVSALQERGFSVEFVPRHTELLGHSNVIEITKDGYRASSDPRSDGSAITVQETI